MNKITDLQGQVMKTADAMNQEQNDQQFTGNLPGKRPPQETAIEIPPPPFEDSCTQAETAFVGDVKNMKAGPHMILVQERKTMEYALRTPGGTLFNPKSQGDHNRMGTDEGSVLYSVIDVNPMCKDWILQNVKPGMFVLCRNMAGNFWSANASKIAMIYEQDIVAIFPNESPESNSGQAE